MATIRISTVKWTSVSLEQSPGNIYNELMLMKEIENVLLCSIVSDKPTVYIGLRSHLLDHYGQEKKGV